jgi:hypothetical protein
MTEHNGEQSHRDGPHFGLILALVAHGLAISEYPEMVRVADIAERYGFGSVWLCNHFLTLSPDDYVEQAGVIGEYGQPQGKPRPARGARLRRRASEVGPDFEARMGHYLADVGADSK